MPSTVRTLLARPELALRLLTPESELPPGAIDAPVLWAHPSELGDPTPFLDAGHLLLTTGTAFRGGAGPDLDAEFADDYVRRLRRAGVAGLGFGSGVVRPVPPELLDACRRHGLPLVEVPYSTPFIAIARTVADAIAADEHERQRWSLAAGRAISRAALRPDGLSATLAELARQLGAWVALIGPGGAVDREAPAGGADAERREAVAAAARELLARGRRGSRVVEAAGARVELQTLGAGGALRGVLAVGESPQLDAAGRELVDAVIALAGLALEQHRDLGRVESRLRTRLLPGILAADPSAEAVAAELWGALPPGLLRVAVAADPGDADADEALERLAAGHGRFHARADGRIVLVGGADDEAPVRLAEMLGTAVGVSAPVERARLERARDDAELALAAASGPGVHESGAGFHALAASPSAVRLARAELAPLVEHDAAHGTELVHTLRVWLEQGAQHDAAARALGVHRHTVRNRVAAAERLLGRELSGFPARAELWAILLAAA